MGCRWQLDKGSSGTGSWNRAWLRTLATRTDATGVMRHDAKPGQPCTLQASILRGSAS